MIDALLVVDMQQGLFVQNKRHDPEGVTERINRLIDATRRMGGPVLFVQHDGLEGESVEVGTPGWEILPTLHRLPGDPVIRKTVCDAFLNTTLGETLARLAVHTLGVVGCCTDFCVDTTIRTAAGRGLAVVVASDAHTTASKLHLAAPAIITHHNYVWRQLIVPGPPIVVEPTEAILAKIQAAPLA